ncbi:hypothetical protein Q7P37_002266 [Cladosporium fusiforme]
MTQTDLTTACKQLEASMQEDQTLHSPTAKTPLLHQSNLGQTPAERDCHGELGEDESSPDVEDSTYVQMVLVMCSAWFGVFLGALDSTIIATLSAPIASEFNSLSLLSWLATAYLLANAACQPIAGRLTDIFGRREGLILSNFLFALGNLLCGFAKNHHTMILGRVIAGIGGGGMISIATFLLSDLTPLRKRGIMQGIANLWYGAGAMLGAVIGGLLQDHTAGGWRLAFLIQVPPSLLLIPAIWITVKVKPELSDKTYFARIDFLGVFLTITFLVLLLLGLNAGGNTVPWTHPLPLTTLPLSAIAFAAFIWWEGRVEQPVIPVRLLKDRTVFAACAASFFISMILMTTTFYLPLYLQVVLGDSTTTAGMKFLSSPLGGSFGALGTGYAMARTGKYMHFGISGALALTMGTTLVAFQNESSPTYLTCIALFFVGGGFSAVLTTATVACLAAVDHSQQALITSALFLGRSIGGTVGITMASAAYQNTLKSTLWEQFGNLSGGPEEIDRILDGIEELKYLPEGWWTGVMESFTDSFRVVWVMMVCWAVLALVSISLLKQHKLHSRMDRL